MSWIFRPRWRAKFGFGPRGTVACVQGWDGWVRSSTRRTSSVIRYLTVVCRIPTGWFNRIRKSLISLFLSGWSSQIFQISSTSRFASIYLDQEEEEWKQMLAEAPVLDVSTSDFWFFAASRDLTLRLGMLLLGWFCRLFPAIFGWCASWSKFLTLVDIYIYIYNLLQEWATTSILSFSDPTYKQNLQLQGKSSDVNCYSPHATASDRLASPYNRSRPILPKIRDDFIGSQ